MPLYRIITNNGSTVRVVEGTSLMAAAGTIGLSSMGLNKTWSGSIAPTSTAITPTIRTEVDLSRASISSELPPITGQERFTPVEPTLSAGQETIITPKVEGGTAPPVVKPLVTLPATSAELQRIATAEAKGQCVGTMKTYYTVKTYKVTLKDGSAIYVESLGEKEAKDKAVDAGYKVAWVTRYFGFGGTAPTETETKPSAATVEIKDEMGGTVLIPKEQFEALPQEYQDIANTTGWRAMDSAMWRDNENQRLTFEKELVTMPKYLQDAYKTTGIDGFNSAVDDYNRVVDWVQSRSTEMWPAGIPEADKEQIRIANAGEMYNLYYKVMQPGDVTDADWIKIKPYTSPFLGGSVDVLAAVREGGVPDSTIKSVSGIDDTTLADAKWQAQYQDSNFLVQQKMAIDRDPAGYARAVGSILGEIAILSIPFLGTAYMAKRPEKYGTGWIVASGATDALVFVAGVGAVSKLVKAGASIPRAVAQAGFSIARGTISTPFSMMRHPIQTAKDLTRFVFSPVEMIFKAKTLPLASVWRGSYTDGFSIAKVLAGSEKEALATQKAMSQQFKLITEGKATSGVVDIPGFGELRFSSTGMQKELGDLTFHATPFGAMYKGAGVEIGRAGLYTADQALLGLDQTSATGQSVLYVFKKNNLIGMIDDAGNLLDNSGIVRGRIKPGQLLGDLKGNKIFKTTETNKIVNKKGQLIGEIKNGGVWTDDVELIGKYYKGTAEFVEDGSVLGVIDKKGQVIDVLTKKVLGTAKPKLVGFIGEGAKVTGVDNIVVGKVKAQPAFVMIKTNGVAQLPVKTAKAKNMKEFEQISWAAFRTGDKTNDLYPVFKQYAKWIEDEGYLPEGTKLVPVLDKKGKPVILATRDIGRKIEMPVMQLVSKEWLDDIISITKEIAKYPIILDSSVDVVKILEKTKNIPPESVEFIVAWLRRNRDAVLIGSGGEMVFTKGKLIANDLDIAIANPTKAMGDELASLINLSSDKKVRVTKTAKNIMVEVLDKGLWKKALDLDDISFIKESVGYGLPEFSHISVGGVNVQAPSSQMARLFDRLSKDFGGKGYERWARYGRALGGDVDIGIGAQAPSTLSLRKLQVRGIWNTVRDIFVPTLEKVKRVQAAEEVAPDLVADVEKMIRAEDRIANLSREAEAARNLAGAGRQAALVKISVDLQEALDEYNELRARLQISFNQRAAVISRVNNRIKQLDISRGEIAREYRELQRTDPSIAIGRSRLPRIETETSRMIRRPGKERQDKGRKPPEYRPTKIRRVRPPDYNKYRRLERLERYERYGRFGKFTKETQRSIESEQDQRKHTLIPAGSIAWKQGIVWKYIPPPWKQEKPISLRHPPIGAQHTGDKTPKQTIQMIGKPKAKVPRDASIDLGVVDIKVSNYGKKIEFTGKGLETSVGQSLASPTVGMSIPASAPVKVKGYKNLAFGTSLSSLVMETYRDDIPREFAEKALRQKLGKMKPKNVAREIRGVPEKRKVEILKMLPDRERTQVEMWLSIAPEYAPTRGWPKVSYLALRCKKKKKAKIIKETELVASVSAIR